MFKISCSQTIFWLHDEKKYIINLQLTKPWRQEEKRFLVNGLTKAKDAHPENNKL